MRKIINNNMGSVVPPALFVLTIIGVGALYSLFFLEVAIPTFDSMIPVSDSKTYIMMIIYAVPLIVVVVGMFALFLNGLKRNINYEGL